MKSKALRYGIATLLILICIMAASFWWVLASAKNNKSQSKGLVYSADFSAQKTLRESSSAIPGGWITSGLQNSQLDASRKPVVESGALVTRGAGAGYAWVYLPNRISRVQETASFKPGNTDGAYAGLIVSPAKSAGKDNHPAYVAGKSVHLAWGIKYLELRLYESVNKHKSVLIDEYQPLTADGTTQYSVQLSRDPQKKNRLYVRGPDGTTHTVDHPLISKLWGQTVLVENYQPPQTYATDKLTQIHQVKAWND